MIFLNIGGLLSKGGVSPSLDGAEPAAIGEKPDPVARNY
jgi:hypothetical protein